ncbi:MAG: ROK family transcriptional regulator [Chloroflexota bacterium]
MKKATHQQTKEHNRNLVLKNIFEHDPISRAEIARITSLTRTTVSEIVAELIEEGLVKEIGVGSSIGGKSPILLSLVKDSRCLIGLDIAQNHFRGAVVNLRGEILKMITAPVIERLGDKPLQQMFQILDQLMDISCQPTIGIGVGTPGLVSTSEGVVINAVNFDWKDLPLARILQDRYQVPVFIYNDSQAAAMGEFIFGQYNQSGENLIVVNVGHGIGAGIILNGNLYQGDGGGAGEIGHVVVVSEGGELCRCGHRGCLETVSSGQAILRKAQSLIHADTPTRLPKNDAQLNLEAIEKSFKEGDPLAQQMVFETARYLGYAVASLVGTLNIHHIVFVGEMTRFGKPWLDVIHQTMLETSLSKLAHDTRLEIGKLESNATLLGATALLANNYSLLFTRRSVMVSI